MLKLRYMQGASMWALVKNLVCGFFTGSAKKIGVSNFIFYLLIAVVIATLCQVISQSNTLHALREDNTKLTLIAQQRLELVNNLKDSVDALNTAMQEQNRIAREQIDFEQRLREQQSEKIETIRNLLKNNQCARDTIPRSIIERLRTN